MFKNEITLDDVIEFIIRHRNDTAAMDEISKASFPFTSKYRNRNNRKKDSTITLTPTPYTWWNTILCDSSKD